MIRGWGYDLILAGSIMPDSRKSVNQKNETNGRGDIFDTPNKRSALREMFSERRPSGVGRWAKVFGDSSNFSRVDSPA